MDHDAEWLRIGSHRAILGPLRDFVTAKGMQGLTPDILEKRQVHKQIRHIQIGGKRYTRPEWVVEWLDSLPRIEPKAEASL
jgi:hypothetical protein